MLTSLDFHNEIIPAGEKTLNLARVGFFHRLFCCCCRATRGGKIFAKARQLNAQELNITAIIRSQRESKAAAELLKEKMGAEAAQMINSMVKRKVDIVGKAVKAAENPADGDRNEATAAKLPLNQDVQEDTRIEDAAAKDSGSYATAKAGGDGEADPSPSTEKKHKKKRKEEGERDPERKHRKKRQVDDEENSGENNDEEETKKQHKKSARKHREEEPHDRENRDRKRKERHHERSKSPKRRRKAE